MTARHACLAALLLAAGCARDTTGDLRTLAAVEGSGPDAHVTFAGVGIGTSREDMIAVFGDTLRIPGDGAFLSRHPGDFGTDLDVLTNVMHGRVDQIYLTYEGNPLALARVLDRWNEVFRGAGAACREGRCEILDAEGQSAVDVWGDERWWGLASVLVTIRG